MNVTNVSTDLTNAINTAVTNGDLTAPLNIPQTVSQLISVLSARELEAIQTAKDLAANAAVYLSVAQRVPTDLSKV